MGKSALKVRPDFLEKHYFRPEVVGGPCNWSEVFGREAPLQVEVGFGNGEFLAWWAGEDPESNFVGMEIPRECLVKASAELEACGRENVRILRGDARFLLRELFESGTLQKVLMQFPLPWPKDRHAKHRVVGSRWAETLADVLVPGGSFELVTDQGWYAEEAAAAFKAHGGFKVVGPLAPDLRPFMTRYERKWKEEGRETWKVEAILARPLPAERFFLSSPMTHHHLPAPPLEDSVRALQGLRFEDEEIVVEVKEVFRSDSGWLLKLVASDESFSQIFFARIVERGDGRALLKLEDGCRPFWTRAVRFGLEELEKNLS